MLVGKSMAMLVAAIAILAVVALAMMVLSLPRTGHQIQTQEQPKSQDTISGPEATKGDKQKSNEGSQIQEPKNYWERFVRFVETRDKFIAAFNTILTLIITGAVAFATYGLYRATRDLVTTKNSSQLQLRAYLVARVSGVNGENGQPLIQIACINLGQTPAVHVKVYAKIDVFPFDSTAETTPVISAVVETNQPEVFIQPKDINDFPVRPTHNFSPEQIQQIIDGRTYRLYISVSLNISMFSVTNTKRRLLGHWPEAT